MMMNSGLLQAYYGDFTTLTCSVICIQVKSFMASNVEQMFKEPETLLTSKYASNKDTAQVMYNLYSLNLRTFCLSGDLVCTVYH